MTKTVGTRSHKTAALFTAVSMLLALTAVAPAGAEALSRVRGRPEVVSCPAGDRAGRLSVGGVELVLTEATDYRRLAGCSGLSGLVNTEPDIEVEVRIHGGDDTRVAVLVELERIGQRAVEAEAERITGAASAVVCPRLGRDGRLFVLGRELIVTTDTRFASPGGCAALAAASASGTATLDIEVVDFGTHALAVAVAGAPGGPEALDIEASSAAGITVEGLVEGFVDGLSCPDAGTAGSVAVLGLIADLPAGDGAADALGIDESCKSLVAALTGTSRLRVEVAVTEAAGRWIVRRLERDDA